MNEFKTKKAKAIENFKNEVLSHFGVEEWRLTYFGKDMKTYVLSPSDVLREMEQETDIGRELIEIWSMNVDKELRKLGVELK